MKIPYNNLSQNNKCLLLYNRDKQLCRCYLWADEKGGNGSAYEFHLSNIPTCKLVDGNSPHSSLME